MSKQNNAPESAWDGRRLTEARLAAAWRRIEDFSQSELARLVGVTRPTIGRYEKKRPSNTDGKTPNGDMILLLARALGCDPGWLEFGPPGIGKYVGDRSAVTTRAYIGAPRSMGRKSRSKRPATRRKFELPAVWFGDDAEAFYMERPLRRRA